MGYANGYVRIYMPNHPHANISGMVYEHVLVAEKKLGRYLTAEEVVHHIDHNRSNNNPDNLMIFKTKKDHSIFHMNEEDFTLCTFDIDGTVSCKSNPLKINHCVRCGCVIYPGATLCRECYRKEARDGRPKRETLKNLIRSLFHTICQAEIHEGHRRIRPYQKFRTARSTLCHIRTFPLQ